MRGWADTIYQEDDQVHVVMDVVGGQLVEVAA